MSNRVLILFSFLLLHSIIATSQIPKGHFLDADDSSDTGYSLKPFKQKKEGIYHYAVLTELPFKNQCTKGISEKEQIACSEESLRLLINERVDITHNYKGSVYIYITVSKASKIEDINIKSYPQSNEIETVIREATKQIEVRPGKFKNKTVNSRLWTSLKFE